MEEELRCLTKAPDYSFARESAVKVKRLVADTKIDWPEEAVRRNVLAPLAEAGFAQLPAVMAMPNRLAAHVLAHVAHCCQDRLQLGAVGALPPAREVAELVEDAIDTLRRTTARGRGAR